MNPAPLSPTPRSTVRRHADRQAHDRAALYAVLDEARVAHLGRVVDGEPVVLPTLHVRVDDTVYVHGSTGAASLGGGEPVCLTVTLLDGLVLARRWFTHSVNYRSAVVRGTARHVVDPDERGAVLRALVEHVAPGRSAATEPPTRRELAATAVLAIGLDEAGVKVRTGPPGDGDTVDEGDLRWAGVVPVATMLGAPETCPWLPDDTPVPRHVTSLAAAVVAARGGSSEWKSWR